MMASEDDMLADRFYEAAFVPELWQAALTEFAVRFGARESGMIVLRADGTVTWTATEHCASHVQGYIAAHPDGDLFYRHPRNERFDALGHRGFKRDMDLLSAAELADYPFQNQLRGDGLEWQAFTRIALPDGDSATYSVERTGAAGCFAESDIARLDGLWPHLGRASITAARLGFERARSAAATMEAIGLAAAVLSPRGTVRASNGLFDGLSDVVRPAAFGGIRLGDPQAQRLFADAVADVSAGGQTQVRSIPVRARESGEAVVLHLLPLRRSAKDLFSGGELMLLATAVRQNALQPEPAVLQVLFDLTAAEARVAIALAAGSTVAQAAQAAGLTVKSARTYLERIFRKTGTVRQSELVGLLRGTLPFSR
jgi:DNA-binding CsgD family transcriptional regulator